MSQKSSRLQNLLETVLKSDATLPQMADGFAIGTFVAFMPIIGFHTVLTLAFTLLLKRNKWTALLANWINNPLTMIPIFASSYWVGTWFYSDAVKLNRFYYVLTHLHVKDLSDLSVRFLAPLWIGSLILGTVFAISIRWVVLYHAEDVNRFLSSFLKKSQPEKSV